MSSAGSNSGIVLSYHDSLLREEDLSLLSGPNWLNDKIIGFYFEYLEYDMYHEYADKVCFITPDVTQFIKLYQGSELSIFLDALHLHEKELILLAVNDSVSTTSAGGSHWSLLVYSRADNTFIHYDSSRPYNSLPAHTCHQRLAPFLRAPVDPKYHEDQNCSQQENGYDCGVYAMCFAEHVCAARLRGEGRREKEEEGAQLVKRQERGPERDSHAGWLKREEKMMREVDKQQATEWRSRTHSLILSLAKQVTSS